MDALLPAFVAVFIASWGDRAQLTLAGLAARHNAFAILAGFLAASAASNALAAWAGAWLAATITIRALTLLLALAFAFAGLAGLLLRSRPRVESTRLPAILAAFILVLAAEIGDRGQMLTFAVSARFHSPWLAAVGGTLGGLAAAIPAVVMADRFERNVPLRLVRLTGAAAGLLIAFILAIGALGLT